MRLVWPPAVLALSISVPVCAAAPPEPILPLHSSHLRVLLADNELAAAVRYIHANGARSGQWHEITGADLDMQYPIYLYLRSRIFHFQLWHYFGPATVEHYEAKAQLNAPAAAH